MTIHMFAHFWVGISLGIERELTSLTLSPKWGRNARKHARPVSEIMRLADVKDVVAAIRPVLKAEDGVQLILGQLTDLSRTDIKSFIGGAAPRDAATKLEEAGCDPDGLFAHATFASALHEGRPHGVLPLVEER